MDDTQLLRYSRHILLNELGVEGQQRILQSRVLVSRFVPGNGRCWALDAGRPRYG